MREREVAKIRRIVRDKERADIKKNITIRGWKLEGKVNIEEMKSWFKEKLNIEVGIIKGRTSGKVIILELESDEMKKFIMVNKSKLK